MSQESFDDLSSESLAVLEREPSTGYEEASHAVTVRARPQSGRTESRPTARELPEQIAEAATPSQAATRVPSLLERFPRGVSWGVTGFLIAVHVGAIAALWFFTWQALVVTIALHFVTACLGVTLGYHRLLTHGSLIVPRAVKYFCTLCAMLSAEGSPLMWVATHRKHHVHSDDDEDPHTPKHGFWWSHTLWFTPAESDAEAEALIQRWAPDLYKDPVQRFFHKTYALYPNLLGVVLYIVGEYCYQQGLSWLLWGLCVRTVIAYHSTWFVNSATHLWGYRNYETTDRSRNLWWVALISYGEGWHNNHHAHQRLARHGHRWWEFDVTYMVIRFLKLVGLATKVQDKLPERT